MQVPYKSPQIKVGQVLDVNKSENKATFDTFVSNEPAVIMTQP